MARTALPLVNPHESLGYLKGLLADMHLAERLTKSNSFWKRLH